MKNDNKTAVSVKKLSKIFKLPHERKNSLKEHILSFSKQTYEEFKVLNDINFEISRGEFLGIVGRNGSGKSTLLKLIGGIYQPSSGELVVNGTLTPFIELGIGFNPELTGKENVYLNGAILGLTRKEVKAKYDEIVEFAELERFMDQKLKNYSSGMQVRLAFSIAIQAHNDILLIDEVLAVGDASFQRKCFNTFKEIKQSGKTVIFVSHDMGAIQEYCDRAILIHEGKIAAIGKPREVANEYSRVNTENDEKNLAKHQPGKLEKFGNGDAEILDIFTVNGSNKKTLAFSSEQNVTVVFKIKANKDIKSSHVGMVLQNTLDQIVFATNSKVQNVKIPPLKKGEHLTVRYTFDNVYTDDKYYVSGAISSSDLSTVLSRVEKAHVFSISGRKMRHALAHPDTIIEALK